MPKTPTLVTAAEISRLAGVTRATVSNWRRRHPDFPAPAGGTEASPAYDVAEVRAWLAARGQLATESPADELRVALRGGEAAGPRPALRLMPLVLAASRLSDDEAAALADLPDGRLARRATELARAVAGELPAAVEGEAATGATTGPSFRAAEAELLRTLLTCVRRQGAVVAADVLAEGDVEETGASGSYQTPAPLAELMARLLTEPGRPYPRRVVDPACGPGGLLVAAARLGAAELYGQDLVPAQAALAGVRLSVLAPAATSRLAAGDSLRADAFPALTADAALCAPPYGDRDWGHAELAADPRWLFGLPPRGEPELAWVQHCLAHLAPGGPAVLLMPPAAAERPSGRRIRAELLRRGALRAVVALPAGAAAPLHVGLHLWLLRRPDPAETPPPTVLFVDTAEATPGPAEAGAPGTTTGGGPSGGPRGASAGGRSGVDWPALRQTVCDVWRAFLTAPGEFADVPGVARAVAVIDLLDETVDLTPVRHVRTAPVAATPAELAATGRTLLGDLRAAATALADRAGDITWPPVGRERRVWRSAAVADLLRGNALTLLRVPSGSRGAAGGTGRNPELVIRAGDVLLPELLRGGGARVCAARVADDRDAGTPLGRQTILLRPDQSRLDPWFLAGFLGAAENVTAAATGSSVVRLDPRRLRVPLLPLAEQRRYGQAFRRLYELRAAAEHAGRLAEEAARTLGAGLTGGALLPPDPDAS